MACPECPTHVVVFPFPAQGHINAALDLCVALASVANVSITFVCNEHYVSQVHAKDFSVPENRFRLVGLSDGLPSGKGSVDRVEHVETMIDAAETMATSFGNLLDSLIQNAETDQSNRPACVIFDFVVWWVGGVSKKFGIPAYLFFPMCASFFSLLNHFPGLVSQGRLPFRSASDAATADLFDLPGFPSLHASELPDIAWDPNPICKLQTILRIVSTFEDASGILVNTIYEMEKATIEGLKQGPKAVNVIAIGPILPPSFLNPDVSTESTTNPLSAADRECLEWLDLQPNSSVLYVSFGSIVNLSAEQIHELAMGLEGSGHRFLWVMRSMSEEGPEVESALPEGFEERMKDRGKVMREWAPQRRILIHRATGGFMTHCGWNSTMESICKGIPLLCWPRLADQGMSSKLVDAVLEVGKAMRKPGTTSVMERKEIAEFVRLLMDENSSSGKKFRMKADLLKQTATQAVLPGGSSYNAMQSFGKMINPPF